MELGRESLVDPGGRFALLFDGRLDNREELGIGEESDASAVLRLLAEGWEALDRFIGPWALLLLDLQEREAHLARDPTGERMLCWHADPARILIASEPAALPPRDLDEETLAAFFAVREPAPDATFFRAVKQVPPGWRVTLSAAGERRHRFWNPDLSLLRGSEADSVEMFRGLLTTAVRAQLRVPGPASGVMPLSWSRPSTSCTVPSHSRQKSAPPTAGRRAPRYPGRAGQSGPWTLIFWASLMRMVGMRGRPSRCSHAIVKPSRE